MERGRRGMRGSTKTVEARIVFRLVLECFHCGHFRRRWLPIFLDGRRSEEIVRSRAIAARAFTNYS